MESGHTARSEDARTSDGEEAVASGGATAPGEQTISPTLQELKDLPSRVLPEETITHLKNAGREALLALYSLWKGIDPAHLGGAGKEKVRKRIDVE